MGVDRIVGLTMFFSLWGMFVFVCVLAAINWYSNNAPAPKLSDTRYEYKIVSIPEHIETALNEFSADGWRVVSLEWFRDDSGIWPDVLLEREVDNGQ